MGGRGTTIKVIAAGVSDVGRQREHNEDSYAIDDDHDLFVVADGMGGHQGGDVASNLATTTISNFFRTLAGEDVTWPTHFDRTLTDEENRLITSIGIANRRIFEQGQSARSQHGMGTTVVSAHFSPRKRKLYVGHVGDSRAYRIRAGEITQLTRDHSLANEPPFDLTEEERAELPRNVITRALGMQGDVLVDLTCDDVSLGDVYLLCSDGLSSMIEDDAIVGIISAFLSGLPGAAEKADLDRLCQELVQAANDAGGEDNVTALAIMAQECEDTAPVSRRAGNAFSGSPPGSPPPSER